jgi:hypothetical protein
MGTLEPSETPQKLNPVLNQNIMKQNGVIMTLTIFVVILSVIIASIVFGNDSPTQLNKFAAPTFMLCNYYPNDKDISMTIVNRVSVDLLNETQLEEYRLNQIKNCHTFWNVDVSEDIMSENLSEEENWAEEEDWSEEENWAEEEDWSEWTEEVKEESSEEVKEETDLITV